MGLPHDDDEMARGMTGMAEKTDRNGPEWRGMTQAVYS